MFSSLPVSLRTPARRFVILVFSLWSHLAFGVPRITEFMASNDRSIRDEDGAFSDWIEIHNPDDDPVDLTGYFLTDNANDLQKWELPAGTTLASNGYLVVFASGKDRANPGEELHANFQLDATGEVLALVAPDGVTILSSFGSVGAPYPRQRPGISYGSGEPSGTRDLVPEGADVRVLVPGGPGGLSSEWMQPGHDESTWLEGAFGVGYDLDGDGNLQAQPFSHWPLDDGVGVVARDTLGGFPGSLVGGQDGSNYWDDDAPAVAGGPESSLRFDGSASHVQTTFDGIGGSASRTVVFWVKTDTISDHGIVAWGDSTTNGRKFHLRLNSSAANGVVGAIRCEVEGGRTVGSTVLSDNQWHHVAVVFEEDDTPTVADVRFYVDGVLDPKSQTSDMVVDTDISGANAERLSIGRRVQGANALYFEGKLADVALYDRLLSPEQVAALADGAIRPADPVSVGAFVATDLSGSMHGGAPSAFVRASFDLPPDFQPDQLRLLLRYDDGFSAFLNGVEVARENAPATNAWNDRALAERNGQASVSVEEFSASLAIPVLRPTGNVLALHGVNSSAEDRDFLVDARLLGVDLGISSAGYFTVPTPGAANGEPDAEAFVADTKFSVDRGFYETPIQLEITSATEGAGIYYTLDGSAPDPRSGELYTGPITINRTQTVRAMAYKDGQVPTNVDTHTYIFPASVHAQSRRPPGFPVTWGSRASDYEMDPDLIGPIYSPQQVTASLRSLPTISVVMDVDDLFGGATGFYANSGQRGDAWEKPCSLEFFDFPDGAQTQLNCGIRAVGRASRSANRGKHNMRLVFRSEYGPKKLKFPLFPEGEVTEFNSLILRGGNGDSWINPGVVERAQYVRDQWHRDVQRATGQPFQHQIYAHLYLNGLYWGMYHVFERFDDDMLAENFGGEEEDWDAIKDAGSAGVLEVVNGDLDAWNRTLGLANRNLERIENYENLLRFIDPDSWIDYFLMNFYSGNTDWDQSNWRAGRKREVGAKWMLFSWDAERTDRNATQNPNSSTNNVTGENTPNFPSSVHQKMTANEEYRLRFADRVRLHCFNGGTLTPEGAEALWKVRADEIFEPLIAEAARWGDRHRSPAARRESPWRTMYATMHRRFFNERTETLLGHLRARDLYPATDAPDFVPHGADFSGPGLVRLDAPSGGTIYYTLDGSDPRRAASAGRDTELLAEGAPVRAWIPSDDTLGASWTAPDYDDAHWELRGAGGIGFELNSGYEGLFGVDLAEMHGLRSSAYARWEFEIADQATLDAIVTLTLRAKYDDGFVAYLNGELAASSNAPATPRWDAAATSGRADGVALQFEDIDISAVSGQLRVGTNVLAVQCMNNGVDSTDLLFVPELVASTGIIFAGLSPGALTYADAPLRFERSTRLKARVLRNGEWSALTSALYTVGRPAAAGEVVISELMYHPVGDAPTEFVELANISDEMIDVGGLQFTEGIEFTVPEATLLAPGERLLIVQDVLAFEIAYGLGLQVLGPFENGTRLANGGERLTLVDRDGAVIHNFVYRDTLPWPETPDGLGKSLVLVAPGTNPDHSDPFNWRASSEVGGDPGTGDGIAFAGGGPAEILAYAVADGGALRFSENEGGLAVSYRLVSAADDARVWLEYSPDLQAWSPASGEELLARVDHENGTTTYTFAIPQSEPADSQHFARLRVELR